MPVGRGLTYGKKVGSIDILISYGPPVYLDDLRKLPAGKETSQKVVDRIIEGIEKMRPKGEYIDQTHKL